jgi:hypothetical protein
VMTFLVPSLLPFSAGTPPEQLGIVPRVAEALFKVLQEAGSGRRATVRCSFVQLYKEQV